MSAYRSAALDSQISRYIRQNDATGLAVSQSSPANVQIYNFINRSANNMPERIITWNWVRSVLLGHRTKVARSRWVVERNPARGKVPPTWASSCLTL